MKSSPLLFASAKRKPITYPFDHYRKLASMYDFVKLHVRDRKQIQSILALPYLEYRQTFCRVTGELIEYPQEADYKGWKINAFSPNLLEIRGSLHQYFTGAANDTDFTLSNTKEAVNSLSRVFNLTPSNARIVNLEFGVNVCPEVSAREILSKVVCYKSCLPINPYQNKEDGYLLDFKCGEAYIKFYDKGTQQKSTNLLRFEVKGMKNRYFKQMQVETLENLKCKKTAKALGKRLVDAMGDVVFTDAIDERYLGLEEQVLFLRMKDGKEWLNTKGSKSRPVKRQERLFKELVEQHGPNNLYRCLPALISEKWQQLSNA